MPHSIPAGKSSPGAVKDEPMDDAGIPSSVGQAAADADVDMAEDTKPAKNNVKLDDLFANDDSDDEEFPSSAPVKAEQSSPPARAASPTYVSAATGSWRAEHRFCDN